MSTAVLLHNDRAEVTNDKTNDGWQRNDAEVLPDKPEKEEADPAPGILGGLTASSSRLDEFGKKITNITCYAFNVR